MARAEGSKVDETDARSPISLLEASTMEASDAALTPFRTVFLSNQLNRGKSPFWENCVRRGIA
jgi:hypothetical protein